MILFPLLPPSFDIHDADIFKKVIQGSSSLGELNGIIYSLPRFELFLTPLTIREAVASSEIENIRTTTLDILQTEILLKTTNIPMAQKETLNYKAALLQGYHEVKENDFLATNGIVKIQAILEPSQSGIRTQMGTVIADNLGNTIYTPPQHEQEIRDLLKNLDTYMNTHTDGVDPLIKMAIGHYQFEAIHPFYDGNGRTGRILMILYLVLVKKLQFPILFLSGYILKHKSDYYRLLQEVREQNNWKEWILFILEGVHLQAKDTADKIQQISKLKAIWKRLLKEKYSSFYSVEMIDYFFSYAFYTQANMTNALHISRPTAIKYMEIFKKDTYMQDKKVGKERIFYIPEFISLLSD